MTTANDSLAIPLYEAMFDSTILIECEKSPTIMIAGTHNNNGMMWSLTAADTVFSTPRCCWLHYPTAYSYRYIMGDSNRLSYWCKFDTMPYGTMHISVLQNYSPWIDTLQFVTTFTPPDTIPDTLPWIHPHTLGVGNLDRFTRIMPNPAHDVVIVFSSYQLKGVTVYDLTGRQLLMEPADGMTATVNVASLPRGTCLLAIRTLQGTATKKLLVE